MRRVAPALAISGFMISCYAARADITYQLHITDEFLLEDAQDLPPLVASVSISDDLYRQGSILGQCEGSGVSGGPVTCSWSSYNDGAPFVLGNPGSPPLPIMFDTPIVENGIGDFAVSTFDLVFASRILVGSFTLDFNGLNGLTYYNPTPDGSPFFGRAGGCYQIDVSSLCYAGEFVREGTSVPEPSSAALLGLWLLGAGIICRPKSRARDTM